MGACRTSACITNYTCHVHESLRGGRGRPILSPNPRVLTRSHEGRDDVPTLAQRCPWTRSLQRHALCAIASRVVWSAKGRVESLGPQPGIGLFANRRGTERIYTNIGAHSRIGAGLQPPPSTPPDRQTPAAYCAADGGDQSAKGGPRGKPRVGGGGCTAGIRETAAPLHYMLTWLVGRPCDL